MHNYFHPLPKSCHMQLKRDFTKTDFDALYTYGRNPTCNVQRPLALVYYLPKRAPKTPPITAPAGPNISPPAVAPAAAPKTWPPAEDDDPEELLDV